MINLRLSVTLRLPLKQKNGKYHEVQKRERVQLVRVLRVTVSI